LAESLAIHVTSCQINPISNNDMNKGRIEKSWGIKRRESCQTQRGESGEKKALSDPQIANF
jgi:hypothetical protein